MNGVVEITITKGELEGVHKLLYGMMGCMEFERVSFINPTDNQGKMFTDLIYGGIYGERMRSQKPMIKYEEVAHLVDEFANEDNYSQQVEAIWIAYNESKWGKDFQKRMAELAKKKEQSEMLSQ